MFKKMVSEKERMKIAEFGKGSNLNMIRIASSHVICFLGSFGMPSSHVSVLLSMNSLQLEMNATAARSTGIILFIFIIYLEFAFF